MAKQPIKLVAHEIADPQDNAYVTGVDLSSDDAETSTNAQAALQTAYNDMTAGVPDANIVNDWPVDADGNLIISDEYDYVIVQRTSGRAGATSDHPARNVVHCFATPSITALLRTDRGREFAMQTVLSSFLRRAGSSTTSLFGETGEYSLPATLNQWLAGKESSGGNNVARGSAKLFNAIAADLAEVLRKGTSAKVVKADIRAMLASAAVMADKFNLTDRAADAEKLATSLFKMARQRMLAHAVAEVKAWQEAPATDEKGNAKAAEAPWPVDAGTGQPTEISLAQYFRPLATWEKERNEEVSDPTEFDLSAIIGMGDDDAADADVASA